MKVILKKSILDQIHEAIEEAELNDKEVEKIVLTKMEALKLKQEVLGHPVPGSVVWDVITQGIDGYIFGVRVETES